MSTQRSSTYHELYTLAVGNLDENCRWWCGGGGRRNLFSRTFMIMFPATCVPQAERNKGIKATMDDLPQQLLVLQTVVLFISTSIPSVICFTPFGSQPIDKSTNIFGPSSDWLPAIRSIAQPNRRATSGHPQHMSLTT